MNVPYSVHLIFSSLFIILCGIINFILTLIRKAIGIIGTVSDIARSNLDYYKVKTWKDIFSAVINIKAVFTLSINTLTAFQLLSGIIGIIIAAAVNSKKLSKKASRFKIIPFICGIITCVIGTVSYIALIFSKSRSVFFCIVMFLTVLTVPTIFTIFANKFRRGDKN